MADFLHCDKCNRYTDTTSRVGVTTAGGHVYIDVCWNCQVDAHNAKLTNERYRGELRARYAQRAGMEGDSVKGRGEA